MLLLALCCFSCGGSGGGDEEACWGASGRPETDIRSEADIQSLAGVECIWHLNIFNSSLTDLRGLESLTNIRTSLTIEANSSLTTLEGLNNLSNITQEIKINRV